MRIQKLIGGMPGCVLPNTHRTRHAQRLNEIGRRRSSLPDPHDRKARYRSPLNGDKSNHFFSNPIRPFGNNSAWSPRKLVRSSRINRLRLPPLDHHAQHGSTPMIQRGLPRPGHFLKRDHLALSALQRLLQSIHLATPNRRLHRQTQSRKPTRSPQASTAPAPRHRDPTASATAPGAQTPSLPTAANKDNTNLRYPIAPAQSCADERPLTPHHQHPRKSRKDQRLRNRPPAIRPDEETPNRRNRDKQTHRPPDSPRTPPEPPPNSPPSQTPRAHTDSPSSPKTPPAQQPAPQTPEPKSQRPSAPSAAPPPPARSAKPPRQKSPQPWGAGKIKTPKPAQPKALPNEEIPPAQTPRTPNRPAPPAKPRKPNKSPPAVPQAKSQTTATFAAPATPNRSATENSATTPQAAHMPATARRRLPPPEDPQAHYQPKPQAKAAPDCCTGDAQSPAPRSAGC